MVIDDGSTDGTAEVARALGVDHIVRMNGRQGLARAFMAGLVAAAERGADIIVNTDADNQYCAADIGPLIAPLLADRADIVIGARPIQAIRHFSPLKRALQGLGSRAVRTLSGADVRDAPSGFRALTRDAALRLNVFGDFTYTIETVIQAGLSNLRIASVPVRVNAPTRPSRLFRSMAGYVCRGLLTMLGVYLIYRPTRIFGALALAFFGPGAALALRYAALMAAGEGKGHVQSVVASGVLGLCAVFMAAIGIVAHLQSINRRLLEEIRYLERSRRARDRDGAPPGDDRGWAVLGGRPGYLPAGGRTHG